tara:strand:+ start:70 stop:1002 length:933 start_codon:yes stop_codon:yes gene_type:complete
VDKITKNRQNCNNITINSDGQRIDNFLIKTIKGVPRSLIYKVIRDGQVRVNSKRVKPSYKLVSKDVVRIPPISPRIKETSRNEIFLDNIDDYIIFENQDFIVINKPAGLAAHSGTNIKHDIVSSLKKLKNNSEIAPVNRLDKNTSGCMLISKNYQSAKDLGNCFKTGKVKKTYTALLSGKLSKNKITIDLALKSDKRKKNGSVFVDSSGKHSLSTFHVEKYFSSCTLANVLIQTGRTHQIRVHASSINHPICGDTKYGDKLINTAFRKIGLHRIFLHSSYLSFYYKRQYSFKSSLPDDLSILIENLENEL